MIFLKSLLNKINNSNFTLTESTSHVTCKHMQNSVNGWITSKPFTNVEMKTELYLVCGDELVTGLQWEEHQVGAGCSRVCHYTSLLYTRIKWSSSQLPEFNAETGKIVC